MIWLQFILCMALIGFAGTKLSRYGDIIADKTGMGGTWVGLVMMASVTSLPELITGISAVTVADAPNIAIGNVLGSCVFNLAFLAAVDFLYRGESMYTRASQGHILSAGFGVMLLGFISFSLLLGGKAPALGHVGLYSPIIVLIYLAAMRTVYRYEQRQMAEYMEARAERYPHITLHQAALRYAAAAAVVVAMGLWLPFLGRDIAAQMGWGQSFVGTLLVALATTVPEMVVTVSAVRIGALDMAVANLLGSNLFNLLLIAVDDVLFTDGPILAHVSPMHLATALSAITMTGAAIVGLLYRPAGRLFKRVGWVSLFLFSVYLLNSCVVFIHGE
ncbi:sodium:calcium antiporter [Sulfuriferula sp. GW1]|uniref:sodium:calcium antiporter n=1 Tax=Sulfuriferula sp. GW1 TaxID=3345111 RepID=UPI0039AEC27B